MAFPGKDTRAETREAIAQAAGEVLDGVGAEPPERAWKALAQAGLLALAAPPRLGGDGLGTAALGVLLHEIGRRGIAVPGLSALALGVLPVARWGSDAQQDALLPAVTAGAALLTAALREPSAPMPDTPHTRLTPGDPPTVTGTKVGVPYAERAQRMLVPVGTADGSGAVVLVDPSASGVSLTRTPSSGGTPEYTVRMAAVPSNGMLGAATPRDLYRCAVAGTCALGAGLLAGALALTVAHVGSRKQFGRPLATFQAVAQQIADVYIAARTLRLAADAAGREPAVDADLDVAAYWLAREAPAALRTCHHLHGGLGLDVSYPLHRYSAQTTDLVRLLGGAEHCLERLGAHSDR